MNRSSVVSLLVRCAETNPELKWIVDPNIDYSRILKALFVNRRRNAPDLRLTAFGNDQISKIFCAYHIDIRKPVSYSTALTMKLGRKFKYPWYLGDTQLVTYWEEDGIILKLMHGDLERFLET